MKRTKEDGIKKILEICEKYGFEYRYKAETITQDIEFSFTSGPFIPKIVPIQGMRIELDIEV